MMGLKLRRGERRCFISISGAGALSEYLLYAVFLKIHGNLCKIVTSLYLGSFRGQFLTPATRTNDLN